jgi:ubiquinone/menaquinone biosynthesis C-methylase UbiE
VPRLAPGYAVWGRTGLYEPLVRAAVGRRGELLRARMVDEARIPAGGRVLDLGTGTGLLLPWLAAAVGPTGRVIGVDLSAAMLARARGRVPASLAIDLIEADAASLPFPDGTFDAVVSAYAVTALADPAAGVAEMVRVARPGARIVVADVHHLAWSTPDRFNRAVTRLLRPFNTWRGEQRAFDLLAAAGLEPREVPTGSAALSLAVATAR